MAEAQTLVLGATGTVGSLLVDELLQLGQPVRAATRNPARLAARLGLEAVLLDLEQPDTFPAALGGVDRAFLIARPGDEHPERLATPLIEQMRRSDVRRVVLLSAMGAERRPDFGLRKVEMEVEASGLEFTHLRPNWFMQVFATGSMRAGIVGTGKIRLPASDAKISFIDSHDIAAVAARALIEPAHVGRAYTLTGGEALDHHQVARLIGEASGGQVEYIPIGEDEARQSLQRAGFPAAWVERLVGFYRMVREGLCAPVSGDVASVLGRDPITFAEFARRAKDAFRPA